MNDVRKFASSTEAAKTGMKVKSAPNSRYGGFRMLCITVNKALLKEYAEKEEDKRRWKEEFSNKRYLAMASEADRAYYTVVKNRQDMLNGIIDKLGGNRKAVNREFCLIPPRQDKLLTINTAEPRLADMSETERNMLIEDSSDNYQETAYLHSLCKKVGIDYKLEHEPEQFNADVDRLTEILKKQVVAHIAEDPITVPAMNTFFRGNTDFGNEDTNPNILCERFDSFAPAVPATKALLELTDPFDLKVRMLTAQVKTIRHDDNELKDKIVEVYEDVKGNGLNAINLRKAEALITEANEKYPDEAKQNGQQ